MLPARVISRRNSLSPFIEMEHWLEDVFGRSADEVRSGSAILPRADVLETEDAFVIEMEIPGVAAGDLKIEFANNVLTVTGDKKTERREQVKGYHRMERSYGSFSRSFTTPATVNEGRITAQFTDGVLRVTLPKRDEAKPRTIEVK